MKRIEIFVSLTAAAALLFAGKAKPNLIKNGGFEMGDFSSWVAEAETPMPEYDYKLVLL